MYENVYFAARLRLPPNTPLTGFSERVNTVLHDVGIWHVKDTVVGDLSSNGGMAFSSISKHDICRQLGTKRASTPAVGAPNPAASGNADIRGSSGGQRKRTSIAMELAPCPDGNYI